MEVKFSFQDVDFVYHILKENSERLSNHLDADHEHGFEPDVNILNVKLNIDSVITFLQSNLDKALEADRKRIQEGNVIAFNRGECPKS